METKYWILLFAILGFIGIIFFWICLPKVRKRRRQSHNFSSRYRIQSRSRNLMASVKVNDIKSEIVDIDGFADIRNPVLETSFMKNVLQEGASAENQTKKRKVKKNVKRKIKNQKKLKTDKKSEKRSLKEDSNKANKRRKVSQKLSTHEVNPEKLSNVPEVKTREIENEAPQGVLKRCNRVLLIKDSDQDKNDVMKFSTEALNLDDEDFIFFIRLDKPLDLNTGDIARPSSEPLQRKTHDNFSFDFDE